MLFFLPDAPRHYFIHCASLLHRPLLLLNWCPSLPAAETAPAHTLHLKYCSLSEQNPDTAETGRTIELVNRSRSGGTGLKHTIHSTQHAYKLYYYSLTNFTQYATHSTLGFPINLKQLFQQINNFPLGSEAAAASPADLGVAELSWWRSCENHTQSEAARAIRYFFSIFFSSRSIGLLVRPKGGGLINRVESGKRGEERGSIRSFRR